MNSQADGDKAARNPPPGGPAALNGFLYQILQHVGWITQAQLLKAIDGQALQSDDWTVVLEARSGADAQVDAKGIHVVEQYKVRAGQGTWSIAAMIDDVLRGLSRAVPTELPSQAIYRFVTDGRPGRGVENLMAFCARVREARHPGHLDDAESHRYGDNTYTDPELFARIVEATRSQARHVDADEGERVCHLVGHFEAVWSERADDVQASVDRLLLRYFPKLHDAQAARRRLAMLLWEKLSEGELRLDAVGLRALFLEADLDAQVIEKVARLAETSANIVGARLARAGYVATHDVRPAVAWPEDRPILVITGASGHGKSWQLAKLITILADQREIVTWSSAQATPEAQRDRITQDLWAIGLERAHAPSLEYMSIFVRGLVPESGHWLTVAVDDVQDSAFARQLAQYDWGSQGVRLAIAAPATIATYLQLLYPSLVHIHEVGEFSIAELDTYLRRYGKSWSELPDDLKQLLKQPILAGLYAQLSQATTFARAPSSEYEIFDTFWQRMQARQEPGDTGVLLALASRVLARDGYPVPRSAWSSIGADPAVASRLQASGWLRIGDGGELAFAHDRLLNWAVAVELGNRVRRREIGVDDLAKLLGECTDTASRHFARPLGYVLMDLLWQLAQRASDDFDLDGLLDRLEGMANGLGRDLYDELLPTLGKHALAVLLRRFRKVAHMGDYRAITIGDGLATIARQSGVVVHEIVDELLAAPGADEQRLGLRLLALQPNARYLDVLWSLDSWYVMDRQGEYRHSTEWWDATRACLAFEPAWLAVRAASPDEPGEKLAILAYLLRGFDHPQAGSLWNKVKAALVTRVSPRHSRGVLECVARFGDVEFLELCIARLSESDDWVDGVALGALARLSPEAALEHLGTVPEGNRYFFRNRWLPLLLHLRPRATQERVFALATAEGSPLNSIGMLFEGHPDEMGPELLDAYLRAFESELLARNTEQSLNGDDWLRRPLDVLGGIASVESLERLRQEKNRPIERLIAEAAKRRIGTTGNCLDHLLEAARRVLLRIAGAGFLDLVTAELTANEYWGRHSGLLFAEVAGDAARLPLHAIATHAPSPELAADSASMERYLALTKLAALGADAELIDAIWQVGTSEVSDKLAYLRGSYGTVDRALTRDALRVLGAPGGVHERLDRALIIAWLSGDTEFIPPIRHLVSTLDASSLTARLACLALWQLNDQSDELLGLARQMLSTSSRWMAINVLASMGERGLGPLKQTLESLPPASWGPEEDALVDALFEHEATRKAAIEAARKRLLRGRASFFAERPYEIAAAESPAASVQDDILAAAFTTDRTVVGRSVDATRALARFDPARALQAAALELRTTNKTADQICRFVVELPGIDATMWLVSIARQVPDDRIGAIGRALRKLPPETVGAALGALFDSPIRAERLVGVSLSAWTEAPSDARLGEMMARDPEGPVRDAAVEALRLRRRLANSARLLTALTLAPEHDRWSFLQALIDSTHSAVLTDRTGDLWLGHALSDLPPKFAHFAQEQLKRKKEDT